MGLASMTGFARADGAMAGLRWTWEVKTVNGRGLDVRVRVPPGFDALEASARAAISARLVRGTCNANLTVSREGGQPLVKINEPVLDSLVAALDVLKKRVDATPPSLDGLLAVKGVVEISEPEPDEAARAAEQEAMLKTLSKALDQLEAVRRAEGDALERVLNERLETIEKLTKQVEAHPARTPEAIKERLKEQVAALIGAAPMLDADRLHQEAVLLATKADVREELDRLYAHVAAARTLLKEGKAVGRRLDFLAQEFGRESNTLVSKSNHVNLTAAGLELKTVVEQFREQVQNVE
ncbi:hypothetical protein IZ6_15850 [Terrihabitans soli]|uniref:YicC family protein n=1 Tax=Terrihabitans soli TaxID=708113 RepID=A0A6S6QV43_9HYPH|nr:YicC/YloC family endoribonuclease [Terrihabitans soli]BCJ90850.1 hypothetical protein IZ6_15850 [Terrihabitans soli]